MAWLSVCSKVQMTCIWFSRCHCFSKIQMVYSSRTGSPRQSWTNGHKTVVVVVVFAGQPGYKVTTLQDAVKFFNISTTALTYSYPCRITNIKNVLLSVIT